MGGEHSRVSVMDRAVCLVSHLFIKPAEQPLPQARGLVGRRERSNVTFPRLILSCSLHDATQKASEVLADACWPPWAVPVLFPEMCL